MDWQNRSKRGSTSGMTYPINGLGGSPGYPNVKLSTPYSGSRQIPTNFNLHSVPNDSLLSSNVAPLDRSSYYFTDYPLYCSDWVQMPGANFDSVALSTYKEGFTNKLQIVHGISYGNDAVNSIYEDGPSSSMVVPPSPKSASIEPSPDDSIEGFDFHKVCELPVDYPITNLQWDPTMLQAGGGFTERLAASSEVLRLYQVDHDLVDSSNDYKLVQSHILANNTTSISRNSGQNRKSEDINTFPPVTSFDWNKSDPSVIITSSVDTTCTVWDLHRSYSVHDKLSGAVTNSASVKTQLIAHDSEVFDVKFIHNSTHIFTSVGNDGSMRVFDLRSLEHSTIIYEPSVPAVPPVGDSSSSASFFNKALLKLSASNVDQHYLATIGANSNQVIIIDMRMPGIPVATLDGSLGGLSNAAINSLKWHPNSNYLLTGGDDCQTLIWDCNSSSVAGVAKAAGTASAPTGKAKSEASDLAFSLDAPSFAYQEPLEVNNVSWRLGGGDWFGVVSGKGFQAVKF